VGVAAKLLPLVAVLAARPGHAAAPSSLEETHAGVSVDWGEGTLTAQGGAAADLHMPSAELARPGAERRARAAAAAKLREALAGLSLGGGRTLSNESVDRALGRGQVVDVEYQSNGGAIVRLRVRFGDWLAGEPSPGPAIAVAEARPAAAPTLRVAGREVTIGAARYRVGSPPAAAHAIAVKIDHDGRWVVKGDKAQKDDRELGEKLAGASIVVYVQKVQR
jgi:hypothetical protein